MMLPDMNKWERRPDWQLIAEGVQCPVCGAPRQSMCTNVSAMPGTMAADVPRTEYHQERKYVAINKFNMDQGNLPVIEKGYHDSKPAQ